MSLYEQQIASLRAYEVENESLRAQIAELKAENERLVREVVDRNRRAFEGDKAKAAIDSSYELYEKLEDELNELKRQRNEYKADASAKQAEIDRLMLEFCPDEMTPEQIEEWGKHQVPAKGATE